MTRKTATFRMSRLGGKWRAQRPELATGRKCQLLEGAGQAYGPPRRKCHSDQLTPVRSLACVGAFSHRPEMRASATPVLANWNRYPLT